MTPNSVNNGILLDTNVWLDYFFPNRASHKQVFQLIGLAIEKEIPLFSSVLSLKDCFYLSNLTLKKFDTEDDQPVAQNEAISAKEIAWSFVEKITQLSTVVGADLSDVWCATKLKSMHNDFEDNLIIATAMRAKVSHLITNDAKLKANAPISALTISQSINWLSEAG